MIIFISSFLAAMFYAAALWVGFSDFSPNESIADRLKALSGALIVAVYFTHVVVRERKLALAKLATATPPNHDRPARDWMGKPLK